MTISSFAGFAVLELDDRVLAADGVGAAVQQPGGGDPAGEGAVDLHVVAELTTSRTRTSGTTDSENSLTPPEMAKCEWVSMIPGMTNMPSASMTVDAIRGRG